MKRLLAVAAVAAVFFALSPVTAWAGSFTLDTTDPSFTAVYNVSGSQGTGACDTAGSCEATVTYTLDAAAGTLTMDLENTSSDGLAGINLLTQLQFNTDPTLTGETLVSLSGGVSGWTVNFDQGVFDVSAQGQGAGEGLDDVGPLPSTGTIVISFTNGLSSLTILDSQVHIQAVEGSGDSDKLICCEEEEGEEGEPEEGEGAEPTSLLLLGTALTAAGVRMRRRIRV